MRSAIFAGAISGIVGLLVFLTIHHYWVRPIWFILPVGVFFAVLGGTAAGWAYYELMPSLPTRPWSSLSLILLIALILTPATLLAELRSPLFDISNPENATLAASTGRAVVVFTAELVLATTTRQWIGYSRRIADRFCSGRPLFASRCHAHRIR